MAKLFHVLLFPRDSRLHSHCPPAVPWKVVERCRARIESEYGTTLETLDLVRYHSNVHHLAGLDPIELACVIRGLPFGIKGNNYQECYSEAVEFLRRLK